MGPKVAPKRGQDSQNDLEQGRRRGQSSKSQAGQVRSSVRVMELTGNQPESNRFRVKSFDTGSIDFGVRELAWEELGQLDPHMCDKGTKMTSKLRL